MLTIGMCNRICRHTYASNCWAILGNHILRI